MDQSIIFVDDDDVQALRARATDIKNKYRAANILPSEIPYALR